MSKLGNPFLKKSDQKIKKKQKITVKMPHVDKKSPARNGNWVETKKKQGLE